MSIRKGKTIIAGSAGSLDWTGTLEEYNIAIENGIIQPDWICYITDDTLYTDDIRPEIETLNSVKANKDLSNLSEVGEKHFLNKSQITNCITEIPQRIKLELKDGTLTLKAGSEVIVPNGFEADGTTPKFDYVTVESDWVRADISNANSTDMVWLPFGVDSRIYSMPPLVCLSGNTQPVNTENWQYILWYDTQNNDVKFTRDYGSTWYGRQSLPLGLVNSDSTKYTSINQIFNGMGYIGSTVWVDKGVKGLIPNNRNEDGTLNNIEFTTDKVTTVSVSDPIKYFGIKLEGSLKAGVYGDWLYDEKKNTVHIENNIYTWMYAGTLTCSNNQITSFTPKQPFRAIDFSDKSEVSGWGIPSSKYIDLTLGASTTIYTAPANGFYFLQGTATSSYGLINLERKGNIYGTKVSLVNGEEGKILFPVKKGDEVYLGYANINNVKFRFIYAEGEV